MYSDDIQHELYKINRTEIDNKIPKKSIKNFLPSLSEIKKVYKTYKSHIDLSKFKNKLYIDDVFGIENENVCNVNYISTNGKWSIKCLTDIDTYSKEKYYLVKLIAESGHEEVTFTFNKAENQIKFVNSIYPSSPLISDNTDTNDLDAISIVNKNALYSTEKNNLNNILLVAGLFTSVISMFKIFKK